ncbi:hypothetical protein EON82_11245 [bacterium]|nr:MAG: hypothetical protein EON82_11245 [bacterium]
MNRKFHVRVATAATLVLASLTVAAVLSAPLSGSIFTTESTCTGVNLNIYNNKDAVYLDGGPAHPGAAGLPDSPPSYYVKVTEPDGTLLGTSIGSGNDTPINVVGGEFQGCYQLSDILVKASDGTKGYDTTSNSGGEYKVWVSNEASFLNESSKTDNFKVKESTDPPPIADLSVLKYYDANADGKYTSGESFLTGWKVNIQDGMNIDRFTPVAMKLDPDTYTVSEYAPIELNWFATGAQIKFTDNSIFYQGAGPVLVTLANGDNDTVKFGNLCVGGGGGLTLGFWSNKNGQKIVTGSTTGNTFIAADQNLLRSLNLRNGNGTYLYTGTFVAPVAQNISYATFNTWILGANATNMANMLSAQLAAMELNVLNGKVNGASLIYAPGTTSANGLGFATVNAVMAEAVTSLAANNLTLSGHPERAHQEALKNALDKANNNKNFVQPNADSCPYTFSEP